MEKIINFAFQVPISNPVKMSVVTSNFIIAKINKASYA
jgi:hypothetical protein